MKIPKRLLLVIKSDDFSLIVLAGLAVGVCITLYILTFSVSLSDDHTRWAEFGSYIGGVIGGTFAVLVFFILIQTLRVNQEELSATRRAIQKQNFESSFMQLLNQTDNEYSKIKIDVSRDAIRTLRNTAEQCIIVVKELRPNAIAESVERKLFNEHIHHVAKSYIDFLQIFLEFISENLDEKISSQLHVKLFTSKLSDDYLLVLIASTLAQKEKTELHKSIYKCDLISFIRHKDSRELLQFFLQSLSNTELKNGDKEQ